MKNFLTNTRIVRALPEKGFRITEINVKDGYLVKVVLKKREKSDAH